MSVADPVPGNLPLFIRRGIHFGPITLAFKDANGVAIDLSVYTPTHVAVAETGSPNERSLETALTNAVGGIATIELTDDKTARDWLAGSYQHKLTLAASGESYGPYLIGQLIVSD